MLSITSKIQSSKSANTTEKFHGSSMRFHEVPWQMQGAKSLQKYVSLIIKHKYFSVSTNTEEV